MPFWLQIVCAVSAGLTAGLFGIALVPFLTKHRIFPPEQPKPDPQNAESQDTAERTQEERRPLMGGLLLLAGIVFSMVLCGTLYLQFAGADRTSDAFSAQLRQLIAVSVFAGVMGMIGFLTDLFQAKKRRNSHLWELFVPAALLMMGVAGFGYLSFTEAELSANHWLAVLPVPLYICFALEHGFQRETDGTLLIVNAVELLALTVLLLRNSLYLPSLLTLAAAGACMGGMTWCLPPAKCRIGATGSFLLAGIVPYLCLQHGFYKELALFMAVFLLDKAFRFFRRDHNYLTEAMEADGITPHGRIAVLSGLAAFCSVMALLIP
ncbi:MAG: hypothetical protein II916_10760 [Oscillospiraceae bacterium]|nr:hypothetical protein [Oscillospiraceae bacterium]